MGRTAHERVKLSKHKIDALQPKAKGYRIYDQDVPALWVRVLPSGVKTWYVTWARNKDTALGKWPGLTVEAARVQARQALIEAAGGVPEVATRKARVLTLDAFLALDDEDSYATWVMANRKSGEATVQRIRAAFPELLDKPLGSLNTWLIEKWRLRRVKEGVRAATINRDLVALKAALSKAVAWKRLDTHPLAEVEPSEAEDDMRVRFLSENEERRLREALATRDREGIDARRRGNEWRAARGQDLLPEVPEDGFADHLTPFVLVSLNTGARRGELTGLKWSSVDLDQRILTVLATTSKGAKTRHIPLNDEAVNMLTRWSRQCKGDRVFAFGSIKTAWKALMERAGITNFRVHDLRHHFASRLVQADVSLYNVQKLLGHSSLRMTERYAHVKKSGLAAAVAKLGAA